MATQLIGVGWPYPAYVNETGSNEIIGFGVYVNESVTTESSMKVMSASSPYPVRRLMIVSY